MDAIRVARAATGRDVICKIEGSYHGHHDAVMFSVLPNADTMGGRERPAKAPVSRGLVKDAARYIEVVPFNDAAALEQLLAERGQDIACLIMEPAMMNIGIVLPEPGYLQRVRELCTRHGVVFIFDEIKTGFTVAAGGAIATAPPTASRSTAAGPTSCALSNRASPRWGPTTATRWCLTSAL